jgi:hypothetical protein
MSKVLLFAASLLLVAGIATAGIINPCGAPVVYTGVQPECYFSCPQGDTQSFLSNGFWFAFTIKDVVGNPIPNIPATDFYMIDCDPAADMVLCGGGAACAADSATNQAGNTTMSQTALRVGNPAPVGPVGRCVTGLSPVCQGFVLQQPGPCTNYCFQIKVRSADLTGDLLVDLSDLAVFSTWFPPNLYNTCGDFDCNGAVALPDLSRFAFHYGPPGHKCN